MKPLKLTLRFVRSYKLLSFGVAAAVIAAILLATRHEAHANIVLTTVSLIALIPFFNQAWDTIRSGRYSTTTLSMVTIIFAIFLGQYWVAIATVIVATSSTLLEKFASYRIRSEVTTLQQHAPTIAHVVRKNNVADIAAKELHEGDKILVHAGEIVPADAVILEDEGNFDEFMLTGETAPQARAINDTILCGTTNVSATITAKVIRTTTESQYHQVVRLVRAAPNHAAPYVQLVDRYGVLFTIVTLTIGGVAWILSHDATRFLDVIVIATPSALVLATSIALAAGLSCTARDGIIVKTGRAFELLNEIKTFAFGKTGTLTHGSPVLDVVVAFKPHTKDDVLAYAAAAEQQSSHPLAVAIKAYAASKQLKIPKTKHVRELPGRGLLAHVRGMDILVGRLSLMSDEGIEMPAQLKHEVRDQAVTYVAINSTLAGYITCNDDVRREAKATMQTLRALGSKQISILTGDDHSAALAVAKQLSITDVTAGALPSTKLRTLEDMSARPVAFVGNGINDVAALMAADLGIALGARGNPTAGESANVIIMRDDLRTVAQAVSIAKHAFGIANQGLAVGAVLSLVLMLAFATGKFSPLLGVAVQEVIAMAVVLNALRAHHHQDLPPLRKS